MLVERSGGAQEASGGAHEDGCDALPSCRALPRYTVSSSSITSWIIGRTISCNTFSSTYTCISPWLRPDFLPRTVFAFSFLLAFSSTFSTDRSTKLVALPNLQKLSYTAFPLDKFLAGISQERQAMKEHKTRRSWQNMEVHGYPKSGGSAWMHSATALAG